MRTVLVTGGSRGIGKAIAEKLGQTCNVAVGYSSSKEKADEVVTLIKENGGKATALNYGIQYSTGEIIVIVDADTIIGRQSLKEIVKGFEVNEHVAAVAGNIKVRNANNWITRCQALE